MTKELKVSINQQIASIKCGIHQVRSELRDFQKVGDKEEVAYCKADIRRLTEQLWTLNTLSCCV